ncbi:hypothetical protein [Streptomyces sp. NBC_00076]|uniref:hypothetical protein n=1 Tax=Streptomyces sp. NBC_00076 TaxID=2975642 RepID=UPI00324BFFE7
MNTIDSTANTVAPPEVFDERWSHLLPGIRGNGQSTMSPHSALHLVAEAER